MSLFKRIAATVSAQVEQTVSQLENHDAVIASAIKDCQRATAQTQVRLTRVRADEARMRDKLKQLHEQEKQWTERAQRVAQSDRDSALTCLGRRDDCRQQIERLEASLKQHETVTERLAAESKRVNAQLQKISEQRNVMRTRQSAAEAVRMLQAMDQDAATDIEDALERWEARVLEAEIQSGQIHDETHTDSFAQRFEDGERQAQLESELDALLAKGQRHE